LSLKAKKREADKRALREIEAKTGNTALVKGKNTADKARRLAFAEVTRAGSQAKTPQIARPQDAPKDAPKDALSTGVIARPSFFKLDESTADNNMRLKPLGGELRALMETFNKPDNSGFRTNGKS
jgi:hypothetical protein